MGVEATHCRAAGLLAATLALAACGGNQQAQIDPNLYPTDFKAALLQFLPGYLGDVSHVQNVALAPPALKPIGDQTRYIACVRYDNAGSEGQSNGSHEYAAIFFAGALNQFVPAKPEQCGGAAYQPFPELTAGKKAGGKSGIFPW